MALLLVLSPSSATAKASPGMPAESTSSISSGAAGAAGFAAPLALMRHAEQGARRHTTAPSWRVDTGWQRAKERRTGGNERTNAASHKTAPAATAEYAMHLKHY